MANISERLYIQIVTDSKNAARDMGKLSKSMKRTETAANSIRKSFVKLNSALAIIGGATFFGGMIKDTIKVIDTYKELGGRLNLVVKDTVGLSQAQEDLVQVALRTYTAFDGVGALYAKMGLATKDLAIDHQTLLDITETVANTLRLSGASAQEAKSSMLQLSQAMASGVLAGDEYRSISENNVALLDLFSKASGKTRGELKKMAAAQEITTEKMVEWISTFRDEYRALVSDLPVTVGRAMSNLKTEWQQFIVEIDKSTNATQTLSEAIVWLSKNMKELVVQAGLLLTVLAASKLAAIAKGFGTIAFAIVSVGTAIKGTLALALRLAPLLAIIAGYQSGKLFSQSTAGGNTNRTNFAEGQLDTIEKLTGEAIRIGKKYNDAVEAGHNTLAGVYKADLERVRQLVSDKNLIVENGIKERQKLKEAELETDRLIQAEEDRMIGIKDFTMGVSGTAASGGGGGGGGSASDGIKELRDEIMNLNEALNPTLALLNQYNEDIALLNLGLAEGVISQAKFNELVGLLADDFKKANVELQDFTREISELEVIGLNALEDFSSGFADTLVDGILEGKMAFQEFAYEFLKEISKMIAKLLIYNALSTALGGLGIKLPPGFVGGLDGGGTIPSGSFAVVGETGPEIVQGPAQVTSRKDTAAMMQQPAQNIRIINTVQSAEDFIGSDSGERLIMNVIGRNKTTIRNLTLG